MNFLSKMKKGNYMTLESLYSDGRYYDLEFRKWTMDIPFYTSLIEKKPGSVLDLGCGTGRVTIPIAKLGVPVTGLDLIPSMLQQAKVNAELAKVEIDWHQGDMTSFRLGKRFDWILLPFNSMQHLHELESLRSTLARIREHLAPDGQFAFDVVNPVFPDLTKEFTAPHLANEFDDPDGKGRVQIEVSHAYDHTARIARTKLFYSIGESRRIRQEEVVLKCFDPLELELFLGENGFTVLEKYGSYNRAPFSAASKELIMICGPG
jgi:SAM-dependent methyltransferase